MAVSGRERFSDTFSTVKEINRNPPLIRFGQPTVGNNRQPLFFFSRYIQELEPGTTVFEQEFDFHANCLD